MSCEPLLDPLDLRPYLRLYGQLPGIMEPFRLVNWVIVGGESGPGFRPMNLEWLENIVVQCKEAGVPCFVKQASSLRPGQQGRIPDALWDLKETP